MNRRKWVLGGWIVLSVFLAGFAFGRGTTKKMESLEIIDSAGAVRGKLGTSPDGSAFLRFYDPNGKVIWEAPPVVKMVPMQK